MMRYEVINGEGVMRAQCITEGAEHAFLLIILAGLTIAFLGSLLQAVAVFMRS